MNRFTFLLIVYLSSSSIIQAQNNLVPNYSFEDVTSNYPQSADGGYYCSQNGSTPYDTYIVPYWAEVIEWTHPLKSSVCIGFTPPFVGTANVLTYDPNSTNPNSPSNPLPGSTFHARTGVRHGFGDNGEILVVPLEQQLQISKNYYFEAYCKPNNNCEVNISDKQPRQCNPFNLFPGTSVLLDVVGYVNGSNPDNLEDHEFRRCRFYFSPNISGDWLSFGKNGDPGSGSPEDGTGLSIDDVRIIQVEDNSCASDTWYFDNMDFNYPHEMFQASNEIILGNGVDPEASHIPGDVTVLSNSETILRAGNRVVMEPGFSTQLGCYFETIIEPCQPNLCPDPPELEDEYISCLGESIELTPTSGDTWGGNFSWTPTTYLSNTDQINPTFTPPSGSGSIEYTLQYSVACNSGEVNFDTQTIEVFYTDHLDPPSIDGVVLEEKDLEIDFELTVNSATQHVDVEVIDLSSNSTVLEHTMERGQEFNSNVFPYHLSGLFSLCKDYKFVFTVENKCINFTESYEYIWDKDQSPTPNVVDHTPIAVPPEYIVISPGNNGNPNYYPGAFCIETEGANRLDYKIKSHHNGAVVKSDDNIVLNSNSYCIWDGYYNNGQVAGAGSYYNIRVTLYNDCNEQVFEKLYIIRVDYEVNGMMISPDPGNEANQQQSKESDKIIDSSPASSTIAETGLRSGEIKVYPNPSKGTFTIKGIAFVDHYTVTDVSGKIVLRSTHTNQPVIHLESYASGIYFLQYHLKNGTAGTEKLVLNP